MRITIDTDLQAIIVPESYYYAGGQAERSH